MPGECVLVSLAAVLQCGRYACWRMIITLVVCGFEVVCMLGWEGSRLALGFDAETLLVPVADECVWRVGVLFGRAPPAKLRKLQPIMSVCPNFTYKY